MSDYQGVLICGELLNGETTTTTKEIINTGRKLSDDIHQPLNLLLIGENAKEAANRSILLGADKVHTASGKPFTESHPEFYLATIIGVCKKIRPAIILLGQTDMGRDIAPRLAARLEATICLDCIELSIDPDIRVLLQSKPVYGGNAIAVWASTDYKPHVVTLRSRAEEPAKPDTSRKGETIPIKTEIDDSMIKGKLLETIKEEVKGIKLEEAKVIVAGGGGIGGGEGFRLIEELAQILRGTVGITRVPRDEDWMASSLEIGQTGHVVSPDLYIAVGISGAPQHLAGCSGSKCIIAINKDPEAHIFEESDFGIVGDYREVLPPLIDKIKSLR